MIEKMKRKELLELNAALTQLKNEKGDKRFKFAINRNLEYFEPEIKAIRETQKDSSEYSEFLQKRQLIGKEFADRDENGNPKIQLIEGNEVFLITERKDEANAKVSELVEEYKEVLEEKEREMKQFKDLMEEEVETDVCKISFKYLPDNADYISLKYIIKETPEEIEEKYL